MGCEPLQSYDNGFLFAKRLYFENDKVSYLTNDIHISDTTDLIKRTDYNGELKKTDFDFSGGHGTLNYQGQSCNDADFVRVNLNYKDGLLEVSKLINATFFEFDLNKDGKPEQYLLGTRNCSQEIVVLRIK